MSKLHNKPVEPKGRGVGLPRVTCSYMLGRAAGIFTDTGQGFHLEYWQYKAYVQACYIVDTLHNLSVGDCVNMSGPLSRRAVIIVREPDYKGELRLRCYVNGLSLLVHKAVDAFAFYKTAIENKGPNTVGP